MTTSRGPNQRLGLEELEPRDTPSVLLGVRPTTTGTATQLLRIDTVARQTSILGVIPARVADIASTPSGELYGVIAGDAFSTASQGEVVRIDTATFTVTTIARSDALDDASALAAAPDGTLYAAAPVGNPLSGGRLVRVIPQTGALDSFSAGGPLDPNVPPPWNLRDTGLAFAAGTLFYTSGVGMNATTFPTGQAVDIRFFNPPVSLSVVGLGYFRANLAFADSNLYLLNSDRLSTLDPATGVTTWVMDTFAFPGITGITRAPTAPVTPDLAVTSAALTPEVGLTFSYSLTGSALPVAAQIDVYWASGTTLADRIGDARATVNTPTVPGTYGPVVVLTSALGVRPGGATHLIVVADPLNRILESDEGNNVVAVSAPVSVPRLTVTIPFGQTEFRISADARMPEITAEVQIEGSAQDVAATQFSWIARVDLPRGLSPYRQSLVRPVVFSKTVTGTRVTFVGDDWRGLVRGGRLTLTAVAVVDGQVIQGQLGGRVVEQRVDGRLVRRLDGLRILGTDPTEAAVRAYVDTLPVPGRWPTNTQYEFRQIVRKMIAHESGGVHQFDPNGLPLWSSDNQRGVGLMQITDPAPTDDEVWDWRRNVARGVAILGGEKLRTAINRLDRLRAAVQREAVQAGGRAAPITGDMIALQAVRGYNGYNNGRGVIDEWRPVRDGRGRLVIVDGQTQWERVPAAARTPRDPERPRGEPNYVNRVLGTADF
jgi:hypothetical protein